MKEKQLRLVLDRLLNGAPIINIADHLQKKCGLPKRRIRTLLASPPRTVIETTSSHAAETLQQELEKLRCLTTVHELIASPGGLFFYPKSAAQIISRELSKTLRSKSFLTMVLVSASSDNPKIILPSMAGPFQDRILNFFRISDTAVCLDDNHMVLLCFTTGRDGIPTVRNKLKRAFLELLGESADISIGIALFPDEARNFNDLMTLAQADMKVIHQGDPQIEDLVPSASIPEITVGPSSSIHLCFTQARGKVFQRLLTMDPGILWLGLSRLPQKEQTAFVDRLPFDSNLVPVLNQLIETEALPDPDMSVKNHFEAIIHQMELEEGIAERIESRDKIISQISQTETLPTLPTTAIEIFNIASNPNSSLDQLSRLIMNDPSLTSKLLQTVNSAFYSTHHGVETVQQAVMLLGTDEIVDIAFGLAAAKVFDMENLQGPIGPRGLWHHSVYTALIAENLCKQLSGFEAAEVFTAALLHDVGKIFFIDVMKDRYQDLYKNTLRQDMPIFDVEEEQFGVNHALIGNHLSTHWNLPSSLVQSIAFHHQPQDSPDHPHLAAIVGLSDYLYYRAMSLKLMHSPPHKESLSRLTYGHWRLISSIFHDLSHETLD